MISNEEIAQEVRIHKLLANETRLKLVYLCRGLVSTGKSEFESKNEVVRFFNRLYESSVSLNELNYGIDRLINHGLLERQEYPNVLKVGGKVGLRTNWEQLEIVSHFLIQKVIWHEP
jgi:hypothetical protein